ncbi:MAG: DNA translocase FtsK 4TM domain-containing protein [Spongiibacteraceae bacterium]|nr:DNA translocase FtsK 4TM domain-containing protein [Spongiibacteraceae bacterium]
MSKTAPTASVPAIADKRRLRLREGAFIGLVAGCVYLFLALLTYHQDDPGWSRTGNSNSIQNAGGPAGAWISDVFFSLFGFMAYLFPTLIAYRAWLLYRDRREAGAFDWPAFIVRVIGLTLVMIASTALVTLAGHESVLPFGAGGVLGQAVGNAAFEAFGSVGGRLVLVAVLLFGLTVFTDLSWLRLMDQIGALILNAQEKLRDILQRRREHAERDRADRAQQKQRRETVARERAREKERKAPVITVPEPRPAPAPSKRAQKERQPSLFEDGSVTGTLPPLALLDGRDHRHNRGYSEETLQAMSRLLELKLADFNVTAEVVAVQPGPVITRFEIQPAPGTKASKITNLAKDLARSLAVVSVRVVEVIPGKSVIGIEIPNEDREIVNFREVLASRVYEESRSPVTLALGHDISGEPVVADLAKMPHLLVAGTTGSGKSVGVNAMLLSILYKATPAEVRLLLVDPKMLELSVYEGIPHLLAPVITDMKDAAAGLRWCVAEMERRYKLMAALGVRNLAGFNRKVNEAVQMGEPILDPFFNPEEHYEAGEEVATAPPLEPLPTIVVVIDEFADMMMIVGKKVEELIARIAQKARAAGIHLILATQRPSVDVITGLIKANIPTRIAFQVSSRIDSRTILDQGGAEQLLGHGDMLYMPPGSGLPVRVHGAFVSDDEVHRVVADWKKRGAPDYIDGLLEEGSSFDGIPGLSGESGDGGEGSESDPLYDEAVHFVCESRRASISAVQRKLRIGYNRAARLIEAMEAAGVVSSMSSNGSREVLAPPAPRD